METLYVILITLAAWQVVNFIIGSLVEKYSRYSSTLETTLAWLNTFMVMIPLWVLVHWPLQLHRKLNLYTLYYYFDDNFETCFLVKNSNKKKFTEKKYLLEGSENLLKDWKGHGLFHDKEMYTYIKKNGYYLLVRK